MQETKYLNQRKDLKKFLRQQTCKQSWEIITLQGVEAERELSSRPLGRNN